MTTVDRLTDENIRLRATLARVQTLPDKWRQCEGEHCSRCAGELETALRSESNPTPTDSTADSTTEPSPTRPSP